MKRVSTPTKHTILNSPFKWAGGKSRLRAKIIELFPPHSCYVEPFSGAAWVLFAKAPSDVEVINDIDQELINFFRVVKSKPKEFMRSFDLDLISRAEFDRLAGLDPTHMDDIERAHRFYYIIMAGWGGELAYPRIQTSITDGGHGNRLFGAIKTLRSRIQPIHERLSTVIIENLDWRECISRYDSPNTLMYLDPPYPDNPINYVHNMRDWSEHQELAENLRTTQCKWILSSYDSPRVKTLYRGFRFRKVQASSGMRTSRLEHDNGYKRTLNREVLITNFDPSIRNRDKHHPTQTKLEL